MRVPFLLAYLLCGALFVWSLGAGNGEFLIYALVTTTLVIILHRSDRHFCYHPAVLWMFDLWVVLHILGGLYTLDGRVLYSTMLVEWVGEPYSILKYDQLVHVYCYVVVALILATVLNRRLKPDTSFGLYATLVVLAAGGIGALNEVVEFAAVVSVPETNVGGYENTLIDLLANYLGALLVVPFIRRDAAVLNYRKPGKQLD